MWSAGCEMWDVRCEMLDVRCWMWDLEWGMRHGNVLPQITQIFTDAVRAVLSKNTRPGKAPPTNGR